jgi:hypothetical protein
LAVPPWLADSHHSIIKDLATDNLFCGFLCVLVFACIDLCAMRLKFDAKKATIVASALMMALLALKALLIRGDTSALALLKQILPFVAVIAWALAASYFRGRVNESLAAHSDKLDALRDEIQSIKAAISLENMLDGLIVRRANGSIYKVDGGLLRYIENPEAVYERGFRKEDTLHLPEAIIERIPVGPNLTYV